MAALETRMRGKGGRRKGYTTFHDENGKECTKCKEYKAYEDFPRCRATGDGRSPWCLLCKREEYARKKGRRPAKKPGPKEVRNEKEELEVERPLGRRCAKGTGCLSFVETGEPEKLSRYNLAEVCFRCEERS